TSIPVPTLAEIGAAGPMKPAAPGSPTAGRGGLMPPPKSAPGAGQTAGRTGSAAAPASPAAPVGGSATPGRAMPPGKPGPSTAKNPKDVSPAAAVAAKLDNRSLIRPAGKPGGGAAAPPPPPTRPSGPQQLGVGTGRQTAITDEIVIHEPDGYSQGGTDKKGRPILKPITRTDAKFRPVQFVMTVVAVLLVYGIDWYLGRFFAGKPILPIVVWLIIAASSVPLVLGGYWVLAPSEAEPYRGTQLWIRVGACAAVYSLLWIARAMVPADWTSELYFWAFVAPPFFVVGAATAFLALDLEGENTLFHFVLFLAASVLLRGVAGLPWV
ncbi:MAG TPA: hypothetical protein VGE52_14275, partial [Pirellulales bacterium]